MTYKNRNALRQAIDAYFDSVSREKRLTETVQTEREGRPVREERPVLNLLGQPVTVREYVVPPTRGGLLRALGIGAAAWRKLLADERFRAVAEEAEERLVEWRIEQILAAPGRDIKGILYDLERNYPAAETGGDAQSLLSLEDKERCLRELCEEIRGRQDV